MGHWTRARYQVNLPLYKDKPKVTASGAHLALARKAAREGMVLLKNNDGLLPLSGGSKVALFGKGTFDYVKGGGGSGDVTCAYTINLYEGLKQLKNPPEIYEPLCDFYRDYVRDQMAAGAAPGLMEEPSVPRDLLENAGKFADTAIISISRFSGEAWDRKSFSYPGQETFEQEFAELSRKLFPESDYYLTAGEQAMVEDVCSRFAKVVVVLNIGGMMDVKWIAKDERISSALLAWQGGMEGGAAAAELLTGAASPCGKLPDSFAADLADYPSTAGFHESPDYVEYTEDIFVGYRYFETIPGADKKVIYPFGYGLTYSTFQVIPLSTEIKNSALEFKVRVKNTGDCKGRDVVMIYYSAPQGTLGKPKMALGTFAKTRELASGESQKLTLTVPYADMASFDDIGAISRSCYVLEKGDYQFFLGSSVRDAVDFGFVYTVPENRIIKQAAPRVVPDKLEKRLNAGGEYEPLPYRKTASAVKNDLNLPDDPAGQAYAPAVRPVPYMKFFGRDAMILFDEVAEGKQTLDAFLAQLSIDEKIHLLGGQPNTGVANTFGFGNLPEYNVPSVMTADGPAGLRIRPECGVNTTAFPCATLLASTWDPDLVEAVGFAAGEEVRENNISIWLTPAVNIHRSPLCGRNFEYYSEDPYLAGILSGAMIRGIQRNGVAAAIKHFCCNNKETNRRRSDSRVSERALREIYLKVFEIAIRTGHPWSLMTSYNLVNGQRCSENRELLEGILREEWGFDGAVMTDWWNNGEQYQEIIAGNDIKMGCGYPERVRKAYDMGLLSEEEITACARRVLELILKLDD